MESNRKPVTRWTRPAPGRELPRACVAPWHTDEDRAHAEELCPDGCIPGGCCLAVGWDASDPAAWWHRRLTPDEDAAMEACLSGAQTAEEELAVADLADGRWPPPGPRRAGVPRLPHGGPSEGAGAAMPRPKSANALLGIPRSYVVEMVTCDGPMMVAQISRKPQPEGRVCPHCGCTSGRVHGRSWRRMFHGPVGGAPCALRVLTYRRLCPDCGRTRYEPDGIRSVDSPHISAALRLPVGVELMRHQSVRSIARRFGTPGGMVYVVLDAAGAPDPRLPRVMRIDELEANTDAGKRAVAIVDGEMGRHAGILPDREPATPGAWFGQFGEAEPGAAGTFDRGMRAA